ncbi:hypothetical protein EBT25_06885 [bacterium]|jgi:hypothetical protein|nr:hypothetical protein [bacterium]
MNDLSPAAQVVLDAYNREARPEPHHQCEAIAAALRAAADQLQFADDYGTRLINADDLLAIATELENQ